ncbi:unnamed protein product [Cladocopium goreaui]|uniref:Uncharacterized protein n=1 Tax=Cladocopium goreaui TaxID=2562237 RepID=A0A9P1C7J6_9DINO|nr:unnamed protein product [Cladocopium goreaui]
MHPKKRSSGGGGGTAGKKAKGSDLPGIPPDAQKMAHMALFDRWLSENVLEKDHSLDSFLTEKLETEDVQRQVAQLIMLNGMVTDANQPGVEKLVATFLVPSWLLSPALDIDMEHGGAYLGPQKIFLVKGWTRAVCCLTVAYALMDCPELLQATPDEVKKWPGAYENVSTFAAAYNVGKVESKAAINLLRHVPSSVKSALTALVRRFTMPKFITHEPLALELLNTGHQTASGTLQPWTRVLTNTEPLLNLMISRMESDYTALKPQMRKPWTGSSVEALQRVCGAFLCAVEQYQALVPKAFCDKTLPDIKKALSAQLLQTTWNQMELQFQSDVMKMREWALKFELFSKQQAAMDFKFLNERYLKGKETVQKFLTGNHKMICNDNLVLGHGTIVEMQAAMGQNGLTILIVDATLWPQRQLSIDEAISVCQSVSSGNQRTLCWFMLPQWHSSTSKTTVVKNRRLLEDKVLGVMDVYEVAVNFADSAHQGMASMVAVHGSPLWSRSKALLGSISNIERSRVNELQNPEPEKPLAPHWRVQQRGVAATKNILLQLLDGMGSGSPYEPLLVVDLLPSRFSEWSSACWELQRGKLLSESSEGQTWDIRFLGLFHSDDSKVMTTCQETLVGRAMSQWWDVCPEAGSRSRPNTNFQEEMPQLEVLTVSEEGVLQIPELVAQKYAPSHAEPLNLLKEKIDDEMTIATALKSYNGVSNTTSSESGTANAMAPARTAASPDWGNEPPLNFRKRIQVNSISISDFDSGHTVDAAAPLSREPQITVAVTSAGNLWLLNRTSNHVDLGHGELFGFNTGSYVEIPSDTVATVTDFLPWCLRDDRTLVAFCKGDTKEVVSLAEVMCMITRERGITECRVIDHELENKIKARKSN